MTKLDYPPKTKDELEKEKEEQLRVIQYATEKAEELLAKRDKIKGQKGEKGTTKETPAENKTETAQQPAGSDSSAKDASKDETENKPASPEKTEKVVGNPDEIKEEKPLDKKEAQKMLTKIKLDKKAVEIRTKELVSQGFIEEEAQKIANAEGVKAVAKKRIEILTKAPDVKDQEKLLETSQNNLAEQETFINEILSQKEKDLQEKKVALEKVKSELQKIIAGLKDEGKTETEIEEILKNKNIPQEEINELLGRENPEPQKTEPEKNADKPEIKIATDVNPEARERLDKMGYKNSDIDKLPREEREKIIRGGIPAEDYYKTESTPTPETTPAPQVTKTPENTTEEVQKKLDEAREAYLEEYKKCRKEAHKQNLIEKTKNSILNIFNKKENKTPIKIEDFFTDELREAEKAYKEAKVSLQNKMEDNKKAELEKTLTGKDLTEALAIYKSTEILDKLVYDERQKIIDAKAEKIAVWKKILDGYRKLPRWQKVAISSFLITAAAGAGVVSAGVFAGSGFLGFAGMATFRFAKSMAMGTAVGHATKSIDWLNKKNDKNFAIKQNIQKSNLQEQYGKGDISLEDYEKSIDLLAKEEAKRYRNRALFKAGFGIALAGVSGFVAYDALGNGISHVENVIHGGSNHVDAISGPDAGHIHNITDPTKVPGGDIAKNIIEHGDVKAVADHGQGAISTLRELQNNLRAEYGNNLDNAPASVKHILGTDAHKLAEEYGMYKPGQEAESAFVKSGSYFEVDKDGNLTYHEIGGNDDGLMLEKNTDIKVSNPYDDKMVDTDHSGAQIEDTPHVEDNGELNAPDQVNPETGEEIDIKNIQETPHIDDGNKFTPPEETMLDGSGDNATNDVLQTENIQTIGQIIRNGLTQIQLDEVRETFNNNIDHLFGERPGSSWQYIQDHVSAERFMEMAMNNEIRTDFQPLAEHFNDLQELTGIHPQGPEYGLGGIVLKEAETIPHFMGRALEEAEKIGVIDQVKL